MESYLCDKIKEGNIEIEGRGRNLKVSIDSVTANGYSFALIRTNEEIPAGSSKHSVYKLAAIDWEEIYSELDKPLIFGDKCQIDALKAYEVLRIRREIIARQEELSNGLFYFS